MLLGSGFFFLIKINTLFLLLLLVGVLRERKSERGMRREGHWGDDRERGTMLYEGIQRRRIRRNNNESPGSQDIFEIKKFNNEGLP